MSPAESAQGFHQPHLHWILSDTYDGSAPILKYTVGLCVLLKGFLVTADATPCFCESNGFAVTTACFCRRFSFSYACLMRDLGRWIRHVRLLPAMLIHCFHRCPLLQVIVPPMYRLEHISRNLPLTNPCKTRSFRDCLGPASSMSSVHLFWYNVRTEVPTTIIQSTKWKNKRRITT